MLKLYDKQGIRCGPLMKKLQVLREIELQDLDDLDELELEEGEEEEDDCEEEEEEELKEEEPQQEEELENELQGLSRDEIDRELKKVCGRRQIFICRH